MSKPFEVDEYQLALDKAKEDIDWARGEQEAYRKEERLEASSTSWVDIIDAAPNHQGSIF